MRRQIGWMTAVMLLAGTGLWSTAHGGEDDEKLPSDALKVVEEYDLDVVEIKKQAELKILARRKETVAALRSLQEKYTRDGKLDEAIAIRQRIRELVHAATEGPVNVIPDPGNMSQYYNQTGKSFYVRVTGKASGSVYGTDVYTGDSQLATAAVHTGLLKEGETGVVKVTMLPGISNYLASTRNGVTSYAYSSYSYSYKLAKAYGFKEPQINTNPPDPFGPSTAPEKPAVDFPKALPKPTDSP